MTELHDWKRAYNRSMGIVVAIAAIVIPLIVKFLSS